MSEAAASNGKHPTQAEHDSLRKYVERRFDEQHKQLTFIANQVKLIGQAVEALLMANGIEDD